MKLVRDLAALPSELRGGAVAIGNFDGVHWGHARILQRLRAQARAVGGPAVVFTFDPHPVRLLRPEQAPLPLTWTDRKAELLAEQRIDCMLAYPTDDALLRLSAREFFDQLLRHSLDVRALVQGPNFFFGRDRSGTIGVLREFCHAAGIVLEVVEPVLVQGEYISSSRIRQCITEGDVDTARQLLTQPYRIRGMVTHGAARGTRLGFPTANLAAIDTVLPGEGVYVALAHAGGVRYPAAVNVGHNPTFGEQAVKVEVHLIGVTLQLYGQPLEVDFLSRLRGVVRFDGVDSLREQLRRDVEQAEQVARDFLDERHNGDDGSPPLPTGQ